MEIEMRIPDDYCQGEASLLSVLEDDEEIYEDRKRTPLKITPRGRTDG